MALKHDFDLIYIVIGQNPVKPINDFETNFKQITDMINQNQLSQQVKVLIETGNIPHLAKTLNVDCIIRGYRNKSDLGYEQSLKQLYLSYNPGLKFSFYKAQFKYRKFNSSQL